LQVHYEDNEGREGLFAIQLASVDIQTCLSEPSLLCGGFRHVGVTFFFALTQP